MLKPIYICLVLFMYVIQVSSQELKVGERVPDIVLENVFNYSSDKIKLSDLKGKLVILDFWGFRCMACLLSFPKMDSLQKMFGDQIQIIMVNKESKDSTRRFFDQRKKLLRPAVPFVTGDTILHKFFPHQGVPFHVWIDSSGIVRYFPEGGNTVAWRIKDFLSGKDIDVRSKSQKRTYVRSFIDTIWTGSMEYYSCISHCINGKILGGLEDVKKDLQLSLNCVSAVELYKIAYSGDIERWPFIEGKYDFDRPGRLILEVKDNFKYVAGSKTDKRRNEWLNNYCYNYQLFWPESKRNQFYEVMQIDLERFFNLEAKVELRKVKCLVLVRTSGKDKLKTKGGLPKNNFFQSGIRDTITQGVRMMNNQPFEKFSSRLERIVEFNFSRPFIDGSGYKGNIDFKIDGEILDKINLVSLKKELNKYDLDLIEKECPLRVLVIKEK
jgi:thiol-disulfide isomerase/thioredoxin